MSTGSATQAQGPSRDLVGTGAPTSESARDVHVFLAALLESQCKLVGAWAGVIVLAPTQARRGGVAANWPKSEDALDAAAVGRLERLGAEVAQQRLPRTDSLTIAPKAGLYDAGRAHRVLAAPLIAAGRAEGATVAVLPAGATPDEQARLERLALSCARFESFVWEQQALLETRRAMLLRQTLELLDASQQGQNARAMGSLMCHELQQRFGCTRASIGLVDRAGGRIRVAAVSGSEDVDRHAPAIESLEAVMEECALQDVELIFPLPEPTSDDPGGRRVLRAHEQLSLKFGPSAILSLPLRVEGDLVGVAVLEREANDPFPAASVPLLRLASEFIGPALWTRRLADRGVLAVARDRVLRLGSAIVGPRHTGAKLIGLLVLALLLAAALVPIPARVRGEAEVRARVSRTVIPPFSGFLDEVLVRPGTPVEEGQLLARMGTEPLELQRLELESRRFGFVAQRDQAQSTGRAGEAAQLEASIDEVDAQLRLLDHSLSRAEIRSPIQGIVSRGDLEDFVGARVEPTQPLFEIVGPTRVIVVQVDERDIGDVEVGGEGWLVSKALPDQRVPVRVTRLNPVAEAVRGANVYLVEAEVTQDDGAAWLRPGMTGTVRLKAGSTTVLRTVLGPIADEIRLRLWW
ncbi:MAG: HlyD family efflux transporter periplasmic adaptor subunit [Phycisphaeraceae bacterium]|nr:HlyD family efflux transporter periplasmic adaptor subunit [Phycisphaeraceae bacterium]